MQQEMWNDFLQIVTSCQHKFTEEMSSLSFDLQVRESIQLKLLQSREIIQKEIEKQALSETSFGSLLQTRTLFDSIVAQYQEENPKNREIVEPLSQASYRIDGITSSNFASVLPNRAPIRRGPTTDVV
jgi:hypothetical protein